MATWRLSADYAHQVTDNNITATQQIQSVAGTEDHEGARRSSKLLIWGGPSALKSYLVSVPPSSQFCRPEVPGDRHGQYLPGGTETTNGHPSAAFALHPHQ